MDTFQTPNLSQDTNLVMPQATPVTPDGPTPGRRLWLKIVIIAAAAIVLAGLVMTYLVVLRGKTALGRKLQDKIWHQMVDTAAGQPTDSVGSISYTDSGTFNFVPSKAAAALSQGIELTPEEAAEIDKFAFTLDSLKLAIAYSGYLNFNDINNPKADMHVEESLTNQGTTYTVSADVKAQDKSGFIRYDFNEALGNVKLFNEFIGGIEENKGKWFRFSDPDHQEDLKELSGILSLQGSPKSKVRDAKRVADVRQIASALELHFNDHSGYPEAENGLPKGLVPAYFNDLPTAPVPADGKCLDKFNSYVYTPKGQPSGDVYPDYEMTFCLGADAGGLPAGNTVLTPMGINPNSACAEGPDCYKDAVAAEEMEENVYRQILRDNRPFSIKSFKGFSLVSGKLTAHYELQLEKDSVRKMIQGFTKESMAQEGYENKELEDFINQVTEIFLDKFQVQDYQVWVGVTDKQVYKSVMVTNAVSITKTADMIYQKILSGEVRQATDDLLKPARQSSRDAKRLADMRQLASGLELYYNDNNGYPGGKDGVPVGLTDLYMAAIPTSPTPVDSPCTDYYNNYWYTPTGTSYPGINGTLVYPSYTYSFCVSQDIGGVQAGNRILSPQGFDGTPPPIVDTELSPPEDYSKKFIEIVLSVLRELPWDAQVSIESTVKQYGGDKAIDLPVDFEDGLAQDPVPYY